MNVIFLTMVPMTSLEQRGIYQDLLRYFVAEGHNVYIVYPQERRLGKETDVNEKNGVHYLGVKTLNLRKSSVIEKGVGQVLVERQFKQAIKKFWESEKFDLILYSTPPITLTGTIQHLKKRNPQAMTYLLLKDIFPQNAADICLLQGRPVQGAWCKVQGWAARGKYLLYKYFRKKEKKLYAVSDFIGCMSPANVEFVLKHNPEVSPDKVEVAPNSVELVNPYSDDEHEVELKEANERYYIRSKYDLPKDRPVFIYGGNLGKPQGIPFLIECLKANANRQDCYIVVVGSGTEFDRLKAWYDETHPGSVKLMSGLPKSDYDEFVRTCDVGLIFLDHRFTIPNFPSRLLSYLEYKMPVLCATDPNCDMGRIAEENGFGYWCESNSVDAFTSILDQMVQADRKAMGEKGYEFLKNNYLVEHTYNAIMKHLV